MRTQLQNSFLGILLALTTPAIAGAVHVTPSQILAVMEDHLQSAQVFKHGQVEAQFEGGTARLSGTVDSLGVKLDAERAVRKMEDVRQVVNSIKVRTDDVTDAQIIERAQKEIVTYYAYGIFDNISVSSEGNKLVVSGEVTQPYKKSDIENILAHVRGRGVAGLDNRLEVLPNSLYDDQLRRAVARAIYRDPYFVHYANQALPPLHIIVKNGNVTLEGVVNSGVDRAKAEADARFAATYFNLTNNLRVEGRKAA